MFFREVSHNVGVMVQFRTLLQGPNEVVGGDAFAIFAVAFFQCALVMRWCLGRECVTVDVHRFVCMCARVLVCVLTCYEFRMAPSCCSGCRDGCVYYIILDNVIAF